MKGVNVGRVVLGGLVAGLIMTVSEFVLNEIVLVEVMAESFAAMNLAPPGGSTIGLFIAMTFAMAITTVWLYAMLRSHSGPGPKTAICTGVIVWFLYGFLCNMFFWAMGMVPTGATITVWVWMLVEIPLATAAGAYLYKD